MYLQRRDVQMVQVKLSNHSWNRMTVSYDNTLCRGIILHMTCNGFVMKSENLLSNPPSPVLQV